MTDNADRPSGISKGKFQIANLRSEICNSERSEDMAYCLRPEGSFPRDKYRPHF